MKYSILVLSLIRILLDSTQNMQCKFVRCAFQVQLQCVPPQHKVQSQRQTIETTISFYCTPKTCMVHRIDKISLPTLEMAFEFIEIVKLKQVFFVSCLLKLVFRCTYTVCALYFVYDSVGLSCLWSSTRE